MKIHIKFYIHISASVALPMVLYKYVYDMIWYAHRSIYQLFV